MQECIDQQESILKVLSDRDWRLRNLYKIKDKYGNIVLFEPNWAQCLLQKPHYLNIILKARQLGITTYHALLFLDTCLFNHNVNAAIVADSKPVAREIFIDKVKFAYDNLPQFVRDMCPAHRDNANEMRFSNGSVFRVATSLRGGTLQLLHITEFAKICQENPTKANEIVSGALNAVQAGQFVCIESTARGREGHFYNLCKTAQAMEDSGKPLGKLDWKIWFFSWTMDTSATLDTSSEERERIQQLHYLKNMDIKNLISHDDTERFGVVLTKDQKKYFQDLAEEHNIHLTSGQKAWYVKKMQTQGEYMQREYPSTPDEAFSSANEGFYFAKHLAIARQEKRICHLPYDDHAKTYTSWDIGIGDSCAIWVWQIVGKEVHVIDYYENSDESLSHYTKWLNSKKYAFEKHYLPHDAAAREKGSGKSFADIAREQGLKVEIIPRQQNEMFGIECLRNMLSRFFFDYSKCEKGIKALENFRKEWNEKLGCYRERSHHNWASHASKSLIYAAEAIQRNMSGSGMSAQQWREMRAEWI